MLYGAYGSNLNTERMLRRCPSAKKVGIAYFHNHRLLFRRGYLTIEKNNGSKVPIGVWNIDEKDVKRLDGYEGYPKYYTKKYVKLKVNDGEEKVIVNVLIYVMNTWFGYRLPSTDYMRVCLKGYKDFGFDKKYLIKALHLCWLLSICSKSRSKSLMG